MKVEHAENIEIVMPVYNGALWIDQMIASIVSQSYENWKLIIRNDGSTDETEELLKKWQAHLGQRLRILPNPENTNLGINRSFSMLLEETSESYVMRADCDDIWYPEKIRVSLDAIRKRERELPEDCPVLVHTDMNIIDKNGTLTNESAWQVMNIRPQRNHPLNKLLFQNTVSGATTIVNRSLIELVLPIPVEAHMDDWWLALVAAAFGKIEPLNLKTMGYRRHGSNDTLKVNANTELNGAKPSIIDRMLAVHKTIVSPVLMRDRLYQLLDERRNTIVIFLNAYSGIMNKKTFRMLETYLNLRTLPVMRRKLSVIRYGLWFPYWIVNIGYLILV